MPLRSVLKAGAAIATSAIARTDVCMASSRRLSRRRNDAPGPCFLTCGSTHRALSSQEGYLPVTCAGATLTAYSGGTVWASHPLRVAAGVVVVAARLQPGVTGSIAGLIAPTLFS